MGADVRGTALAPPLAMIKVGLCGWTIGMREYFERFPVVEVQQTFYEPPSDRTLLRWRESAPEGVSSR